MIKESLFTAEEHKAKLEKLGDMLQLMENHANFKGLAAHIDQAVPRLSQKKGGRPPFPTELMVRVLVPRQLHGFCDKRIEHQLMDRLSFQRFVGLRHSSQIPAPPLCHRGRFLAFFSIFRSLLWLLPWGLPSFTRRHWWERI